jgi:hypothetical protein
VVLWFKVKELSRYSHHPVCFVATPPQAGGE